MSDLRLVYDMTLKRPGCVLLQASMGGSPSIAAHFSTDDWLLAPTPDMRCYSLTKEQLKDAVTVTARFAELRRLQEEEACLATT